MHMYLDGAIESIRTERMIVLSGIALQMNGVPIVELSISHLLNLLSDPESPAICGR